MENTLGHIKYFSHLCTYSYFWLFVASEFAVVKVRKSRIDQLANEGNKQALAARSVLSNLDVYLSACQLGITITSLGLGWLGEPTVEHILRPLFEKLILLEQWLTLYLLLLLLVLLHFSTLY